MRAQEAKLSNQDKILVEIIWGNIDAENIFLKDPYSFTSKQLMLLKEREKLIEFLA